MIFKRADLLITYNGIGFDYNFLRTAGVIIPKDTAKFDVMLHYAELVGEWDDYHGGWKWHKLVDCARSYGYAYHAHESLDDVKATAYCFQCMTGKLEERSVC